MGFVIGIAIGLAIAVITFFAGIQYRKKIGEAAIKSAEDEAKRIIDEAVKTGETKKKEALIEAKEEIIRNKNEAEREAKERRKEIDRLEKRAIQKEETLDKKIESCEKTEESYRKKIADCEEREAELEKLKDEKLAKLEELSGLTADEAKDFLLKEIESQVRHETAVKINEIEQEAKDEAETRARNIVALAIQRIASDHVSETTVSTVALPNDEMKGRIIGREGRNIKSIENITGVDLIIDDTPEAITVSSFDPVRREVARLTLEKLISDGRIHPARIEEMYEKARREVDATIKQTGERTLIDAGVNGVHPELVKLLGKLKYRTSYGQNVLNHSLEVSYIAGLMAAELGADVKLAKRAGLLHDIGKALDHEMDGSHVELGVEAAKKYHESEGVIHAIQAHHGDVEAKTLVACLVQAADAVSASRPGARRENVQNYIKRLEKLEAIASSFEGVERSFAIQAGREVRIMVKPEVVTDEKMVLIARDIVKKIEDELEYPGQIKVNIIRESRVSDYAK